jgi:uncharacterized protein (DUF1800 family)
MSARDAVTALRRFGLGARPGEPSRIVSDPRGFVMSQLDAGRASEIGNLPTSAQLWREVDRFLRARRRNRKKNADQDEFAQDGAMGVEMGDAMGEAPEPMRPGSMSRAEMAARFDHAVTADSPLLERLVGFWSNHFTIAIQGAVLRGLAGSYEREAIRPHVLGSFRDMLHAVVRHPAMLVYLDNHRSIGPNSRTGRRHGRGLNENLAREILELHTVGVNGGYTQDDVISFARALTGWTVDNRDGEAQGTFMFKPQWHEPGAVTIMGRTYPEGGVEQAEAVLDDLAAHPATARHVARKLAVHFVSEKAPLSLVERLESAFRQGAGDLDAVTRMLVSSGDAWGPEPRKVLPPYDFVIAVFRALEHTPRFPVIAKALRTFGHGLWMAPSPAGWPDEDEAWASPHGVVERLDWVKQVAAGTPGSIADDVRDHADGLFGGTLSDYTRQAIARSETREQALALMFMSPEFQRR